MESVERIYPNETVRAISEFLFVETPPSELGQCDLTVVLGNDFIDGTMLEVRRLLDAGVILPDSKIVLSGATGLLNAGKEKECLRLFRSGTEKFGISPSMFVLEDRASNSYENLAFTRELIETDREHFPDRRSLNDFCRILFIGKSFMMRRVEMCARRLDYPPEKLAYYGTVDRDGRDIGKDSWWKSETAASRVYGELERIGKYAAAGDLSAF